MLRIADTQATNMTSESTPAPTPNANRQAQTAANDVGSSNTPIRTSGRIMLRNRNDTSAYAKGELRYMTRAE